MRVHDPTAKKYFLLSIVFLALWLMGLPGNGEAQDKFLKIGILGPMQFIAGEHQYWGAQLSAEEINNAGGVRVGNERYKIELVKKDSNELRSVVDAVSAMEKIITQDKCKFIMGTFRTEATLAQQEVMADHKVILIGIGSAHPKQTMRVAENYDRYKYYFRVQPNNSAYQVELVFHTINKTATAVREALGVAQPKVALLVEKAAWTEPMIAIAKDKLPKMGMEIIGTWQPSPLATDCTAELSAIKSAGAHMIFSISSGPVGAVYSRQWGELQIPTTLGGISVEALQKSQWKATGGMCEYETAMGFHGLVAISDKSIPFYNKFSERFGQFPSFSVGNDAIYVLKEAIERAGTLNTDSVVAALEKTDYVGTIGRITFHDRDHKFPHDLVWAPGYVTGLGLQWQDGKLAVIWPDGRASLGEERWKGVKYGGTAEYKLPPRFLKYWKDKK